MEWCRTAEGEILREVEWVPAPNGKMKMLYPPLDENNYVDVGGVDPYYKDESMTSDSFGSVHIYRGNHHEDTPMDLPVFEYVDRPKQGKEEFYENCIKIAIWYNCKLLVEDTDEEFFKWFLQHGFGRYLKEAPMVYKSVYSKAANRYGFNMAGQGRKVKLVDTVNDYIKTDCEKIYFLDLLKEFTIFGIKNTDRVMSFGLSLIHSKDNAFLKLKSIKEQNGAELRKFPIFRKTASGIYKVKDLNELS